MPHLRATLLLVLAFASLLPRVSGQEATAVGADTPLRRGTLPNGLQYAVLPHHSPKGDISLRLVVRAGSLDERDDERGFAHFVEHMAFNGTRRYPPGSIRAFFQRLGMTFGPDVNATTSYTHTNYLLDLPDNRPGLLDEALALLRDYADGLLFPAEEVKREGSVVLSELRARDNQTRRTGFELIELMYGGTRLAEREVGGLPDQIERATPEQLRAFYRRHYQPARMTVIVVGTVDVAATIEQISAVFGSLAASPDAVPPASVPDPLRFPGAKPAIIPIPTTGATVTEIMYVRPRPGDAPEARRQELIERIATDILNARLRFRRENSGGQFGQALAQYMNGPAEPLMHHRVSVSATAEGWSDAVQLAETEIRRARINGFTQAEVDEAVAGQMAAFRNRVATVSAQSAEQVAGDLARFLAGGRTWLPAEAGLAEATAALRNLTAAEVSEAAQGIFPAESVHLTVFCPPGSAPRPDRVLAAYTRSAGRALRRTATEEELVFNYTDFGPPGRIAKRERVEDLDLTLVSFANGVRLNVRPSTLEPERFRLRVVFPVNYSHVSAARGGMVDLAGHLLLHSDFRRQKKSELERLIRLHGIVPQFGVGFGTPFLTIVGPVEELPFALQFLTALLSDLQFGTEHYRTSLGFYGGQYRSVMTNAAPLALREAVRTYTGNDARVMLNPPLLFAPISSETERWVSDHILRGQLEVGLVGDFSIDTAIATAANTLGAVTRRATSIKPGTPLSSPKTATRQEVTADIPASASAACILWPVNLPNTPRQSAALSLATDVLRDRLALALRDLLGATYSPDTHVFRDPIQRDFAFVSMTSTFDPARARQMTEGSVRLAARLAERGVSPDEFARVREPARARHAQNLRSNAWWLDTVVAIAQTRPAVLDVARQHEKVVDEVTLEDVNLAAQIFKPDAVTAMILRPKSATGDAKAPNPKAADKN